ESLFVMVTGRGFSAKYTTCMNMIGPGQDTMMMLVLQTGKGVVDFHSMPVFVVFDAHHVDSGLVHVYTYLNVLACSLAVIVMTIDGMLLGKEGKLMNANPDGINNTIMDHCVGIIAVNNGLRDSLYLSSGMGCFIYVIHDGLSANVANFVVRET
nr:hypothetical protein [Tanacetum cinerariifolium]